MKKIYLFGLLLLGSSSLSAQVMLSGMARHYTDSVFFISEQGGFHPVTQQWRDQRVKVTIGPNGHFAAMIPERAIGSWMIQTPKDYQFFDLVGGQSLEVEADFSRADQIHVVGDNAGDFHFSAWLNQALKTIAAEQLAVIRRKPGLDSVLEARLELARIKTDLTRQYQVASPLSDTYAAWLQSQFRYEPYERTLVENISDRDAVDEATMNKLLPFELTDDYAALHTAAYVDLVSFYMYKKFCASHAGKPDKNALFQFTQGGLITGLTRDAYLARVMAQFIKDTDTAYQAIWVMYDTIVQEERLKAPLREARIVYEQGAGKSSSLSAASSPALSDILKKYRGKLVYLDFWASWCAPCRAEMPHAVRLREKLKDQPVVFVYLGYNDQPAAWQKARMQLGIQGEHYLLDSAAVREADVLFGINGIPHYAIIGADGQIVQARADRPGVVYERLVEEIKSMKK